MANSKQIVYLSQAQYAELISNGNITANGVTVTYDENDIYVTPQAEPVTDVRVAGTSVAANGVANIPIATQTNLGVAKGYNSLGINIDALGNVSLAVADTTKIKAGASTGSAISPGKQHESAFYGLAKASGDTTQSQSDNEVGTYTPEAKGAIQKMLGVTDIIATEENDLTASKPYAIGDIFVANGKLYKATVAIAQDATIILPDDVGANCEETNLADTITETVPTESTAQELLSEITNNSGLTDIVLKVLGMYIDSLPQNESAEDIRDALKLEADRLDAVYDLWLSEKEGV